MSSLLGECLSPHSAQMAVRLLTEIVQNLHFVAAKGGGVLFALPAGQPLAEDLGIIGAAVAGTEEHGHRWPSFLDSLGSHPVRHGHPVPAWTPPVTVAG